MRRVYRFTEAEGTLQIRSDRRAFKPYGLYGGQPGRPSTTVFHAGTEEIVLPAKITRPIRRGDVVRHDMPGAGGWGDPLTRDPARVLRDVRNGLVSLAGARNDYGVIVDPATWTADAAATEARRSALAAGRGWSAVPTVSR
jgi:N-methylhydantoinase B